MNKAVFIDKDGTLIVDIPYNADPALIRLQEHAIKGLQLLQKENYKLIIVSNQPGIALGYFSEEDFMQVKEKMKWILLKNEIFLNGFYYCAHFPESFITMGFPRCGCRKPSPGLLLQAAKDLDIDLSKSWMIGDILNDVEAGKRAGCKTVLIDNGNETEWILNDWRIPDFKARHLDAAADYIVHRM